MKKLNFKAVFIGTIADVAGSVVFGAIMGMLIASVYAASNGNMEGFEEYYNSSTLIMVLSLLIGLIFVSIGSYLAGKIAKEHEIINALGVGVLGIILGMVLSIDGTPQWYSISSYILILPFAYAGGIISIKANTQNEA